MKVLKKFQINVFAFVFFLFALLIAFYGFKITSEAATAAGTYRYDLAWEVLDLLNNERAKVGQPALKRDQYLTDIAMLRASEVSILDGHTRPDGTPWYTAGDTNYLKAENVATIWQTPEIVNQKWTDSPGHYANMISGDYDGVGIGCFEDANGNLYWSEEFGVYRSSAVKQSNYSVNLPSASSQYVTVTNLENFKAGIEVTWSQASNIDGYYVYRRQSGGSWKKIATVSSSKLSYKDASVKGTGGTVYEYYVTAYTKWDGAQSGWTSRSITRNDMISASTKTVTIKKAKNYENYIKIKWGKKKNVDGYFIYRKLATGSTWTKLTYVDSDVSTYEDHSVKGTNHYKYHYKVTPYTRWDGAEGTGNSFYFERIDISSAANKTITIKSATNCAAGIQIKWGKTKVADKYYVYRSENNGSWRKLASVDASQNTYKDTGVKGTTGTSYKYKVTPYTKWDQAEGNGVGYSTVRVDRPKVKSIKSPSSGTIKVKCSEVSGADSYRVYYGTSSDIGKANIAGSPTNSLTIDGLSKGKTYYIWVSAVLTKNKTTYESAATAVKTITVSK